MTFENEIRVVKESIEQILLAQANNAIPKEKFWDSIFYVENYKSILRILENLNEYRLGSIIFEASTVEVSTAYCKRVAATIIKGVKEGE